MDSPPPAWPPDDELWSLVAADDHQAFTLLYERHAEAVWNYAYRLSASWLTADDLLSTTFLTAWTRRRDVVLVRDSALPWLYTVTGNVFRGERRRTARFLRAVPRLLTTETTPDHAEQLAERGATRDRLRLVLAAIDRLPRSERDAVRLCLLGNTSVADAAELFGISPAGVRARLSRARAHLQQSTAEENDD